MALTGGEAALALPESAITGTNLANWQPHQLPLCAAGLFPRLYRLGKIWHQPGG
jgi:hypothetical protein